VEGQIFVLFVMVVAAAEVAVGLAVVVAIFRESGTININDINLMKW
jgi:NADH-quinone oxidoreductase subunit K